MGCTDPRPKEAGSPVRAIMTPKIENGMSVARLGELKRLAYHSSSLDDLGDAVIELIEEVIRLRGGAW